MNKYTESTRIRMARYRERGRAIIREAKSKPCTDCDKEYPYYVMDLDHVKVQRF